MFITIKCKENSAYKDLLWIIKTQSEGFAFYLHL